MKKPLVLLMSLVLLLILCGCSYTNARDPLLFIPREQDGAYLTDRGILRVDDGLVTAGAMVTQLPDGTQTYHSEGPVELPGSQADITQALPTAMTVGQARTALEGMLKRIPTVLDTAGYLLECCPEGSGEQAPAYTFSVMEETLTEGKAEGADESLGSFLVDDAGPLARIWIKP